MGSTPTPVGGKAWWRAEARRRRRPVEPATSAAVRGHVARCVDPSQGMVLAFLPLVHEVDLTPWIDAHADRIALPRIAGPGRLTLHPATARRRRHRWGFDEPESGAPEVERSEIRVALVPGLLFAADGTRLGHGAGHYDRLLAGLAPATPRVGVSPVVTLGPTLPSEPHDVSMTAVVTPAGWTEIDGGGGR